MQIVRRHSAAAADGVFTTRAPAAASGATRSGLMSWTITSNPALTRFNAIGPPMAPTPTNPTFPVMTISPCVRTLRGIVNRGVCFVLHHDSSNTREEIDHGQQADGVRIHSEAGATARRRAV